MGSLTLLEEARRTGVTVFLKGEELVVRGPRSAESLARQLLARKPEIQALLAIDDPEVASRATVMGAQIPERGRVPFLVYCRAPYAEGVCLSCGDSLPAGMNYRCRPCAYAAQVAVLRARQGINEHV